MGKEILMNVGQVFMQYFAFFPSNLSGFFHKSCPKKDLDFFCASGLDFQFQIQNFEKDLTPNQIHKRGWNFGTLNPSNPIHHKPDSL